ncbi:MAG: hypothetical protein N2053_08915 [Chitinispirillaceae bacterium]|nr:hypothetical protein [Chitinispirillaceae bacterium]
MWTPYEIRRNHLQDFDVKYRFYTEKEGGRRTLPFQGYRCDFAYEGDDIKKGGIYCIHPEFEDENGDIITDENKNVNSSGTARMWVLFPEMRQQVHKNRIKVGTKGYFMEGSRKVGEVEVIRIVGLYTNE